MSLYGEQKILPNALNNRLKERNFEGDGTIKNINIKITSL